MISAAFVADGSPAHASAPTRSQRCSEPNQSGEGSLTSRSAGWLKRTLRREIGWFQGKKGRSGVAVAWVITLIGINGPLPSPTYDLVQRCGRRWLNGLAARSGGSQPLTWLVKARLIWSAPSDKRPLSGRSCNLAPACRLASETTAVMHTDTSNKKLHTSARKQSSHSKIMDISCFTHN